MISRSIVNKYPREDVYDTRISLKKSLNIQLFCKKPSLSLLANLSIQIFFHHRIFFIYTINLLTKLFLYNYFLILHRKKNVYKSSTKIILIYCKQKDKYETSIYSRAIMLLKCSIQLQHRMCTYMRTTLRKCIRILSYATVSRLLHSLSGTSGRHLHEKSR